MIDRVFEPVLYSQDTVSSLQRPATGHVQTKRLSREQQVRVKGDLAS